LLALIPADPAARVSANNWGRVRDHRPRGDGNSQTSPDARRKIFAIRRCCVRLPVTPTEEDKMTLNPERIGVDRG